MKTSGKDLSFWFDDVERPVESVSYDSDYTEIDTTDSSVESPASDSLLSRTKRTTKTTHFLREADGAEISTGTLTKDVVYIVSLGTVDGHVLGEIFTSDGTETCDSANKVKPIGAVILGKDITVNINSTDYPVTSFKFDETYGEFDTTDSATTGDARDFIAGRCKRTGTIEVIMDTTTADYLISNPSSQSVTVTFATGLTLVGNLMFKKKSSTTNSAGDMVKVSYDFNFVGSLTNNLFGLLTPAISKACTITWYKGASTDKAVTGNVMVLQTSIETDIDNKVLVTTNMNWIGAPTESIAN